MISDPSPTPTPGEVWNTRYATPDYVFGTKPNEFVARKAALWHRGDRVLCVADGEGRNSVFLASRGLVVDAFDVAPNGIAKAKALAAQAGVTVNYALADCDAFAWPRDTYDGVAAIFVQFATPPMRARLFANIVSALRPGGHLVLMGYTPKQLEYRTGGPPQLDHLYTAAMLRTAFAGMEILEMVEYEPELDEGPQHRGRSAVIGMVARKTKA